MAPQSEQERVKRLENEKFREGVRAAKADLNRGVLAYEAIECEEEENWRILWCYRKLLKDQHGIDYRVYCPSPVPGAVGYTKGYQSVVKPIIVARLGPDWSQRIYEEAKTFYRTRWSEVEHLYKADLDW